MGPACAAFATRKLGGVQAQGGVPPRKGKLICLARAGLSYVNLATISNVLVNEYVNLATISNVPKTKYMTLGPKFFCCSKMTITRRRKHLQQ